MHIFKSRNPIWLILDIIITVVLWRIPVVTAALFFTVDSILQLLYTFLPDMVDAWDKNAIYRAFYSLFLAIAIFFIIRYLVAARII